METEHQRVQPEVLFVTAGGSGEYHGIGHRAVDAQGPLKALAAPVQDVVVRGEENVRAACRHVRGDVVGCAERRVAGIRLASEAEFHVGYGYVRFPHLGGYVLEEKGVVVLELRHMHHHVPYDE